MKEMQVTNQATIKIQIMGKLLEVVMIARSEEEANEYCETHSFCSVIAEDEHLGLIFIVKG